MVDVARMISLPSKCFPLAYLFQSSSRDYDEPAETTDYSHASGEDVKVVQELSPNGQPRAMSRGDEPSTMADAFSWFVAPFEIAYPGSPDYARRLKLLNLQSELL